MVLAFHMLMKGNFIYIIEIAIITIIKNITRNIVRFCLQSLSQQKDYITINFYRILITKPKTAF